ncbi:uncharacterized protein IUM83_15248 [Phytophthora cinnamomi]|uniref:uncharacterized protein n=1 Tax=Phytophthora cinnamomi TaxID=4785 RepID=UPI00355A09DF|nr:hypothetical protein IUM83_15248 [Phytophthora cinnamomi]
MDGEDFETLEAALALIDECEDDPRTSSGSDGGDPEYEITVDKLLPTLNLSERDNIMRSYRARSDEQEVLRLKAKLAVPGRNRSRDLHRLELLELWVEAAALQQRVDDLEEQSRQAIKASSSSEELCLPEPTDDKFYYAWKNLARKQKQLRRNAELENQKLRELLACQLKCSTTIKRILRKQTTMKDRLGYRGLPY